MLSHNHTYILVYHGETSDKTMKYKQFSVNIYFRI